MSLAGDEIYFFGIINFLKPYNSRRRSETVLKRLFFPKADLSSVSIDKFMYSIDKFMYTTVRKKPFTIQDAFVCASMLVNFTVRMCVSICACILSPCVCVFACACVVECACERNILILKSIAKICLLYPSAGQSMHAFACV